MRLSIREAAAASPASPALIVDGQPLDFGQLAALVERAAQPGGPGEVLEARPELGSIVSLLAALEAGRTAVLLHPALGEEERRRALEAVGDGPCACAAASSSRSAVVVFTSGTSGRPKPVGLSEAALLAAARASAAHLGWNDGDRWLLALPFAHVGGLSVITRCLLARQAVVLAPQAGRDPAALIRVVERDRVTLASLVPTQLRRVLEATRGWRPPAHLRRVLVGGAAAPSGLLEEARERGWPVVPTYGLSETCAQVATGHLEDPPSAGLWPLPGIAVRLVDGEIQVGGPTLMTRTAQATEEGRFTADGWLRTGDLGELDAAGRLHLLGRMDDRLKTGGEVVDPLEVEQVLEGFEAVAEACVFGVPDRLWGQRVAAAVVLRTGQPLDGPRLAAFLAGRLARFKCPKQLAVLESFPAGPTGKRDRRTIGALAREVISSGGALELRPGSAGPGAAPPGSPSA